MLTFHRVVDIIERDHDVEWPSFLRLVRSLNPARVTTDLLRAPEMGGAIVMTFDDATSDHARVGEELASLGLHAVFFVPPRFLDDPGRLTRSDVTRLIAIGQDVGGHGYSHVEFNRLTVSQLEEEITRSATDLATIAGSAPRWFAPPGGRNHPALIAMLESRGFSANRTMRWGLYRSPEDRWQIPCIPVTEFTLKRGWVGEALATSRLPIIMRATWTAKQVLPSRMRESLRHVLHGLFR